MKLHHIGFVVKSIDSYAINMPVGELIARVYDPIQKADLALYTHENTCIELIEPKEESSFTYSFLQKHGSGYHHLCYEANSISAAEELITKYKMLKVLGPVPAVLFDGKQVIFAYDRNKSLVEFLIWH